MNDVKKLLSNSFVVFVGTIISSFCAYLFNMLMGRYLGPVQYGALTAISSMLSIITVISGAVFIVSMRYSGEFYNEGLIKVLRRFFAFLTKNLLIIGIFLFLLGILLTKPIGHFFSISQSTPLIIGFVSIIFGLLIVINRGFLQGAQRFLAIASLNVLEMGSRLLLGIFLVLIGFNLNGAISAMVLATAITYGISFISLNKVFKSKSSDSKSTNFKFDKKEIINYTWPTLLASFFLAIAINVDIILVKHYFDPEIAGVYAAISTIAKIILYATSPIIGVMFPMVSEKKVKGDKHFKIFLFSLLLTLVGSLIILALYMIAPAKVILVLYGSKYISLYQLLPEAGLFIAFYTLSSLVANYFMVIKNFIFLIIFGLALALQITLIALYHPSLFHVVRILILTNGILFASLLIYYLYTKKEQIILLIRGNYES